MNGKVEIVKHLGIGQGISAVVLKIQFDADGWSVAEKLGLEKKIDQVLAEIGRQNNSSNQPKDKGSEEIKHSLFSLKK